MLTMLFKNRLSAISVGLSAALVCFSAFSAKSNEVNSLSIHDVCNHSPQACLTQIDDHLANEKLESRIWFQFKLYKLQALFQLVDFESLGREVLPWVERQDIPMKFRINVLIYYAKVLKSQGQPDQARYYMNQAIETISDVNEVAFDPMLVVQIANGLNHLGEYQRGYDLLKPLEVKYRNRPMAKVKHELFENLGHFAYRLGKLQEHLSYRLQALEWARELGNDNQTAISLYNVARAHQMLNDYERAFHYFDLAEKLGAMGKNDQNMINYRRAEMALAMKDIKGAQGYFGLVNRNSEFESYVKMFDAFEVKLLNAKLHF